MSIFAPEGGPHRLLRFVPPGEMPSSDTLALYDQRNNLVIINKEAFDTLTAEQQYMTITTTTTLVMD